MSDAADVSEVHVASILKSRSEDGCSMYLRNVGYVTGLLGVDALRI
jgi:hypothetical protein